MPQHTHAQLAKTRGPQNTGDKTHTPRRPPPGPPRPSSHSQTEATKVNHCSRSQKPTWCTRPGSSPRQHCHTHLRLKHPKFCLSQHQSHRTRSQTVSRHPLQPKRDPRQKQKRPTKTFQFQPKISPQPEETPRTHPKPNSKQPSHRCRRSSPPKPRPMHCTKPKASEAIIPSHSPSSLNSKPPESSGVLYIPVTKVKWTSKSPVATSNQDVQKGTFIWMKKWVSEQWSTICSYRVPNNLMK